MKYLYCVLLLCLCACSLFGCTSSTRMFESSDNGYLMLNADAEGLRAFNDGQSGLISNSRIDPNLESSYWQHRKQETAVRGLKFKRVEKKK